MSQNTKDTMFESPFDWENWSEDLQRIAVANDVWKYMQPENRVPWPQPVMELGVDAFEAVQTSTPTQSASSSSSLLPPARSTRSASTTQAGTENENLRVASSFRDLTTTGRSDYAMYLQVYSNQRRSYNDTAARIEKVQQWFTKSVSHSFKHTCCRPTETMDIWYDNLKKTSRHEGERRQLKIRAEYKEWLKPMARPPKNWDIWIDTWERVMAEGIRYEIPEIQNSIYWTEDLGLAIRPISEPWWYFFQTSIKEGVKDSTLDYHLVASDLRKTFGGKKQILGSKVGKGVFSSIFGTEDTEPPTTASEKDKPAGKGKGKKRARVDTEGSERSQPPPHSVCKACSGRHHLSKCFYALNEFPDSWRPNETVVRVLQARMDGDQSFAKEVEKYRKQSSSASANKD